MKKSGGANPFNLFVIAEMECMHRLLAAVRETLLVSLVSWSVLMNLAPRWLCTASYPGGGGGTPKHYLNGYVPPKGVGILKLLI